jgi:hypothetical protein
MGQGDRREKDVEGKDLESIMKTIENPRAFESYRLNVLRVLEDKGN